MVNEGENLTFIVGHYKSGSTWLDNALSCHHWFRGISETHIFRYILTQDLRTCTNNLFTKTAWSEGGLRKLPRQRLGLWLQPLTKMWKPVRSPYERPTTLLDLKLFDQFALKRKLLRSASKEDYCRNFFQFLYEKLQPYKYLVEKTPTNMPYVPYIKSVFPKSKLLAIYRDGRDVTVSEKFMKNNLTGETWSFHDSVQTWRSQIELQMKYEKEYNIFTCSYESLLQDGKIVMCNILNFLDIPTDDTVIDNMLYKSSFQYITGRNAGDENQKSFYRKGISGDWKSYFTEDHKKIFKDIAGDLLIKLGYEKDYHW